MCISKLFKAIFPPHISALFPLLSATGTGGINGPSGVETPAISSENVFSKTCTGGWDVEKYFCVDLNFSSSRVPCPLSQSLKKVQLGAHQSQEHGQCPELPIHIAAA